MTRRLRTAALPVVLLVALAILRGPAALHGASGDPILVLVSFDGWRWDYAAKFGARPDILPMGTGDGATVL